MQRTVLDDLLLMSELLQRDMAREFAGTSLSPARVRVLWVLHHGGASTQRDLAKAMEVSARNVSGLVDALEADGYVRRTRHPTDRRAIVVELTESASERMTLMQREHAALSATLLAAVSPEDRPAVGRAVQAMAARLTELVEAAHGQDAVPAAPAERARQATR